MSFSQVFHEDHWTCASASPCAFCWLSHSCVVRARLCLEADCLCLVPLQSARLSITSCYSAGDAAHLLRERGNWLATDILFSGGMSPLLQSQMKCVSNRGEGECSLDKEVGEAEVRRPRQCEDCRGRMPGTMGPGEGIWG